MAFAVPIFSEGFELTKVQWWCKGEQQRPRSATYIYEDVLVPMNNIVDSQVQSSRYSNFVALRFDKFFFFIRSGRKQQQNKNGNGNRLSNNDDSALQLFTFT